MMTRRTTNRLKSIAPLFALLWIAGCSKPAPVPLAPLDPGLIEFESPVRLTTDEGPVRVETPGYASPCWADVDRDGNKDLLVGQFKGGKIRVYKNLGNLRFASGEWLQADGQVATVPGVW